MTDSVAAPPVPENPDERWKVGKWGDGAQTRVVLALLTALAVVLGAFQVYTSAYVVLDALLQRVIHLMLVLVLVFLTAPAGDHPRFRHPLFLTIDVILAAASVAISLYIVINYEAIVFRMGSPTSTDITMGTVAILVLLEATRRTAGRGMMLVVIVFLLYAYYGPYMPGTLAHRGFSYARIVYHLYLFQEGIYGLPLGVAATFVFTFILFGALLEKTGAGQFFIDLAYALTGRSRGGPAKAAVVGSAMMGSISGSAIANVVTTGAFTIPMMKKVGYAPREAAGVEAAASTGGQMLPPVMGAGAFIMAELLGIPYGEIVKIAIIPALMYFVGVFFFVDIIARRRGIEGLRPEEIPDFKETMRQGFQFLIPLILLLVLLFRYYSPLQAGLYAMLALIIVSLFRAHSRISWRGIIEVFEAAARGTLTVSVACAAAGIVVGIVGLTGLGLRFSSIMLTLAGENLFAAIILIGIASLFLGMGLPVTASYVILAVLAGPALVQLGLTLLAAHMIVFWYSQDSNVTPPVALASFAAAGIAGCSPMHAALSGWKYALGLYVLPFMMAYTPILTGTTAQIIVSGLVGTVALLSLAAAIEGYFIRQATWPERLLMVIATVLLVPVKPVPAMIGLAIVLLVVLMQRRPLPPTAGGVGIPS